MKKSFDKLKVVAEKIAELDDRVAEVFIHSNKPNDPLEDSDVELVCHLTEPRITQDIDVYNDEGFAWGLDMAEKVQPTAKEQEIKSSIIVSPFNLRMHESGEYGEYYHTLFLKSDFEPALETADEGKKEGDEID